MASVLSLPRIIWENFPRKNGFKWLGTHSSSGSAPLMVKEVLQLLNLQDNQTVLDLTFGDGFHSEAVLRNHENVKVISLDRDPCTAEKAAALSLKYPNRLRHIQGRFSDLPKLIGMKKGYLDAVLIDVGCSEMQLNDAKRGFSPDQDGPLDMRMGSCETPYSLSALDLLMNCSEHDLKRILKIYGGEEQGKKIASAIVSCRHSSNCFNSTVDLRDFVLACCDVKGNKAVKNVFYALRTFVNNEFNELNYAMLLASVYLKEGGRIVTLTFNKQEDTIVKRHITGNILENSPNPVPLKYYSQSLNLPPEEVNELRSSIWCPLTKHVVTPSDQRNSQSQRYQTAKLRAAIRL